MTKMRAMYSEAVSLLILRDLSATWQVAVHFLRSLSCRLSDTQKWWTPGSAGILACFLATYRNMAGEDERRSQGIF